MFKDLPEGQTHSVGEDRMRFEKHFAKPPYEWTFERYKDTSAWPGNYRNFSCECAWDAWQAAKADSQAELKFERQAKWELAQQLSAALAKIAELQEQLDLQRLHEGEVERGFKELEMLGVPRERARHIANGISVYATRMWKEANALKATIEQLEQQIKESREQEPVCWKDYYSADIIYDIGTGDRNKFVPLYASPIIGEKK